MNNVTFTTPASLDFLKYIRPSSIAAVAKCPARPKMEAAYVAAFGELPESDEASLGTTLHKIVEAGILHWKAMHEHGTPKEWGEVIAWTINLAGQSHEELTSYDLWCAEFALGYARDLIIKHEIEPDNVLVEQRLEMPFIGPGKGGTADLVLVIPFKRIIVVDWKFGFIESDSADENDQLGEYAAAAAATFKTTTVEIHLVQPRAEKLARANAAVFQAKELADMNAWTQAVVARASVENPELHASYDACRYCAAFTRCKEARDTLMNFQEALAVIGSPDEPDQWGKLAEMAKLAAKFGKDGVDLVKEHINKGGVATGWKLQPSGSIKVISDPKGMFLAMEQMGMREQALNHVDFSLTGMSPDTIKLVGGFIELKPKAPSLKPDKAGAK